MKRIRWKMHEVFKAIGNAEHYQRAMANAEYSSKKLGNEVEAKRWLVVAKQCEQVWIDMGLGEIVSDIKRIF